MLRSDLCDYSDTLLQKDKLQLQNQIMRRMIEN